MRSSAFNVKAKLFLSHDNLFVIHYEQVVREQRTVWPGD